MDMRPGAAVAVALNSSLSGKAGEQEDVEQMSWARRGEQYYYYRSVRVGRRVENVYLGCGRTARQAAAEVLRRRWLREERRRDVQALVDAQAALVAPLGALGQAAELLARASLVAAGFHEHNRCWRQKRPDRAAQSSRTPGAVDSVTVEADIEEAPNGFAR